MTLEKQKTHALSVSSLSFKTVCIIRLKESLRYLNNHFDLPIKICVEECLCRASACQAPDRQVQFLESQSPLHKTVRRLPHVCCGKLDSPPPYTNNNLKTFSLRS